MHRTATSRNIPCLLASLDLRELLFSASGVPGTQARAAAPGRYLACWATVPKSPLHRLLSPAKVFLLFFTWMFSFLLKKPRVGGYRSKSQTSSQPTTKRKHINVSVYYTERGSMCCMPSRIHLMSTSNETTIKEQIAFTECALHASCSPKCWMFVSEGNSPSAQLWCFSLSSAGTGSLWMPSEGAFYLRDSKLNYHFFLISFWFCLSSLV